MSYIIEKSRQGGLQIPPEMLPPNKSYTYYQLEVEGDILILRPQKNEAFWATATPTQRAARFRAWSTQTNHPVIPPLPDEALSRETMYN